MSHGKVTPSNCKLVTCPYNPLAPGENDQECLACDGLKDPKWRYDQQPAREEKTDGPRSG